jgi:phage terminase large subunit GpA-like protein
MNKELKSELLELYSKSLKPPYFGSIKEWVETNVELPAAYAIPGKLDLSISPYLLQPLSDIENPKIMQVNLAMATQLGKSLLSELCIPYWICNAPGPIFRIFHNKEVSDVFMETRLIPLLKKCPPVKPLLDFNRFSSKKGGILLPHMSVTVGGSGTALQHGMSVKYLLCDEVHQFEVGEFNKFQARTTAFSGRRKIICASQPNRAGSEWDQISSKGLIYEWNWCCPKCNTYQPFYWSKEKKDGGYAGFNWDTVLNPDGDTTNIVESAKTTWLECINCDHKVMDTPSERRQLNDMGKYTCIKPDGDPTITTYTCPNFVNVNLSFAYASTQYMLAKRMRKQTGLDEQIQIFVNQILGKFYKKEEQEDLSKVLVEHYEKSVDKDWITVMGVDVQRIGKVKYYVVRSFHKNGNESRRLEFGVVRTWDEVEALRSKYNIPFPLVHVDSGDGEMTNEVYQECVKHGKVITIGNKLQYVCWTPTKGDGSKMNYRHQDGIMRLFAPVSNQDSQFPMGHKLRAIPAPLILFSNLSIKTILGNLRDNLMPGIKWMIDVKDEEYDKQIYSEGLVNVVDKKSGLTVKRWIQRGDNNHYWDAECLCLVGAVRANAFSATKIDESDMKQLIESQKK